MTAAEAAADNYHKIKHKRYNRFRHMYVVCMMRSSSCSNGRQISQSNFRRVWQSSYHIAVFTPFRVRINRFTWWLWRQNLFVSYERRVWLLWCSSRWRRIPSLWRMVQQLRTPRLGSRRYYIFSNIAPHWIVDSETMSEWHFPLMTNSTWLDWLNGESFLSYMSTLRWYMH